MAETQLSFSLTLQKNLEGEAARQCRALMSEAEWRLVVAFALQVVLLQEAEQQSVEYWVAPRARE